MARLARDISKPVGVIEMALAWPIQLTFDEICPSPASRGPTPNSGIVPSNTPMKLMNPKVMNRFVIRPTDGCIILLTQT